MKSARTARHGILILLLTASGLTAQEQEAPTPLAELDSALMLATARIADVESNLQSATPGEANAFEYQLRQRWREHHAALSRLVASIEATGVDSVDAAIVGRATDALTSEIETVSGWITEQQQALAALLVEADAAAPDSRVADEVEVSRVGEAIDGDMLLLLDDYDQGDILGLDNTDARAEHEAAIMRRTESVGALLELALSDVATYRGRQSVQGIDTTTVALQLAASEERVRGMTASLQAMVGLMTRLDRDPSVYRQLIVTSTGRLGTEVLDTQVLGGLLQQWGETARAWVAGNAGVILLRLAALLLIFFAAVRLSRLMRATMTRLVAGADMSSLIKQLMVSAAGKTVWLVALLVVLWLVGIDLGPALAGLGIAGFVLGFALQDTLSNFAAGLMIMIYRPFDVGDFVTAGGVTGNVKDLTLVSTLIQTLDNKRIIVPNGKVWGDVINNATAEEIRRVDLVFGIHYDDDVDHAREVLESVLAENERVLDDPEPVVRVGALGDSSVDLICRPWCRTEDYWEVSWELTRAVKKRFDAEGISFPFPQRDVHVYQEKVAAPATAAYPGRSASDL